METPLVTLSEQLGLTPSQIIPVIFAIIFLVAKVICSYPPPIRYVIKQLEPADVATQSRKSAQMLFNIDDY